MTTIRDASKKDLTEIVNVHRASFPGYFLTILGPRFLETMYTQIMAQHDSVCLVADDNTGGIVGFVVGVSDQHDLFKRLAVREWFRFALAALPTVIQQPEIIPRLMQAFRYPRATTRAACPALIMRIAVSPKAQGKGLGKDLVRCFLDRMGELGERAVSLTTHRDANDFANAFCRKVGFTLAREYRTPFGDWRNEYVISIDGDPEMATRDSRTAPDEKKGSAAKTVHQVPGQHKKRRAAEAKGHQSSSPRRRGRKGWSWGRKHSAS